MITQEVLEEIKIAAQGADWNGAFGGKSKGNQHLVRVAKIAMFLAKSADVDRTLVEVSAWLHDIALSADKDDYNYEESKEFAIEFLQRFNLTEEEKEQIAECIATHEAKDSTPKTIEAKIVHDADVLDKTCILGMIRHAWKLVNLDRVRSNKIGDNVEEVIEHIKKRGENLFTSEAKRLHNVLQGMATITKEDAKRIIQTAAQLAEKIMIAGKLMITENIAAILLEQLSAEQRELLNAQLCLSYLQ